MRARPGDARRQSDPHGGRSAAPADTLTDNGTVIPANKWGERGLTMEPVYQGEPILAVAAVDELTAAEAIEKIRLDFERAAVRAWIPRNAAARRPESAQGRQHLDPRCQRCREPAPPPHVGRSGPRRISPKRKTVSCRWARRPTRMVLRRRRSGFQERRAGARRNFRHAEHQPSDASKPARAMAYWQNGKVYVH